MNNSTSRKSTMLRKIKSPLAALALLTLISCGPKKAAEEYFPTPDAAVVALVDAAKTNNTAELETILGPDAKQVLFSGDEVADRRGREIFVAAYFHQASLFGNETTKTLYIGGDYWPFPIPVVKDSYGWHFDTGAGIQELLDRRIGRNELAAIDVCHAFFEAQKEYAQKPHDGKPAGIYAQRFMSTPGKQDGLYWKVKQGDQPSPLGELAAEASAEGYTRPTSKLTPFYGYYYRILTAQGTNANGGASNYIVDGQMRGGFALVAYPAEYRKSGVMTFIVNQDGIVYQKVLGPDTAKIAAQITKFDPDSSWEKVAPEASSAQ